MEEEAPKNVCTVCLLSHHPLVLEELEHYLSGPGLNLQLEIGRVELALANDLQRLPIPSAVVHVVDSNTPLQVSEFVVGGILDRYPAGRVIALVGRLDEANAFPLLRLGVKGLLSNTEAPKRLTQAVETVIAGGFWVPRLLLSRFMDSLIIDHKGSRLRTTYPTELSRRELEVLNALIEGMSNKEIGCKLNIAESTVKFHISNLLAKFHVPRRADLMLFYWRNGASLPPLNYPIQ